MGFKEHLLTEKPEVTGVNDSVGLYLLCKFIETRHTAANVREAKNTASSKIENFYLCVD
jgi:hypothetical protein